MTPTERRQRLRAMLAGPACLSPATVFDALSARVAESVGYEIGVLSGSVSAGTLLAAPDLVLQTLTEFAEQVRRIMRVSRLSLVLDADHGYGNALNVMRARGARVPDRFARRDGSPGGRRAIPGVAAAVSVLTPAPRSHRPAMQIARRMRISSSVLSIAMLFPMIGVAHAQGTTESAAAYPTRPVRVTIAFAPGGGVDILARAVAQKLGETMGRPFVVENRAGAGGTVAYAMVAKAPPDGYSLLAISGSFAMSAALYQNLPYDPVRDFAPITQMGAAPFLIVAHPSLPVRSVKDLIALARARPGALNFASGGLGSSGHLTGELFKSMTGVQMTYIPYKGGEPALIDLIAGQVDLVFSNALSSLPHVRSGRVRPLAVTSAGRYGAAPEIPTVAESGVPGFEAVNWYGWLAPAGVPGAIVSRLNAGIGGVVRTPELQQRFARDGAEPITSTPAQFSERIVTEVARWRKVVKQANLRVE